MRRVILGLALICLAPVAAPHPGRAQAAIAAPVETAATAAAAQAGCAAAHCLYLPAVASALPISVGAIDVRPGGGKLPGSTEVFATARNYTGELLCDVRVSFTLNKSLGEPLREE